MHRGYMSPLTHGGSGVQLDGCISLLLSRKVTFMYRTAIVIFPIIWLTCSIKQSQSKRLSANHYCHCIIVKHLQATSNPVTHSNLYINLTLLSMASIVITAHKRNRQHQNNKTFSSKLWASQSENTTSKQTSEKDSTARTWF